MQQPLTAKPKALHHPLWPRLHPSPTPADCKRQLGEVIPLRRLQPLTPPTTWWHRDGHLRISSSTLIAASVGSPFLMESLSHSHLHWLLLGHEGTATVTHPSGTNLLNPNGALLIPGQSWTLRAAHNTSLSAMGFDPLRLLAAARAMAPPEWHLPFMLQLPLSRVLTLSFKTPSCSGGGLVGPGILPALGQINRSAGSALEASLIEDHLYKQIACLVFPSLHQSSFPNPGSTMVDHRLDPVLNYISHHLDQPLPLSVLEVQSNYCRRSLHYAFQERFQCSPMQWIRQQRMALALQRLQCAKAGETVRAVASACGYNSTGRFSIDFQRTYGCKPSSVLRGDSLAQLA